MTDYAQVKLLTEWASAIDLSSLQNEDDVETKIVLPFFKLLGYPDDHRRGKFPVDDYQSRRSGRKQKPTRYIFQLPNKRNKTLVLLLSLSKQRKHK